MKLFKNEVGRPSNEVLRKRNIVKISIAAGIIAFIAIIVGVVTLLLGKSNTNDLKGVPPFEYGATSADYEEFNQKISVDIKFNDNVKSKVYRPDNRWHPIFYNGYGVEPGIYKAIVTITNNNDYNIYYDLYNYESNTILKKGTIYASKTKKLSINIEAKKYDVTNSRITEEGVVIRFTDKKGNSWYGSCGIRIDAYDYERVFLVAYDSNGGVGRMKTQEVVYGTKTVLSKNAFAKQGYKFTGWKAKRIINSKDHFYGCTSTGICKEKDAAWLLNPTTSYLYKDQQSVSQTVPKGEIVTMIAQWEKDSSINNNSNINNIFTVKYDSNGGTGSMNRQQVVYGKSTKLSKNMFTKEGYKFVGWKAKKIVNDNVLYKGCRTSYSCSENNSSWLAKNKIKKDFIYSDGMTISKTVKPGETVTMIAQWKKDTSNSIKPIKKPDFSNRISDFFKNFFNTFK